jgi:hypothetical protein
MSRGGNINPERGGGALFGPKYRPLLICVQYCVLVLGNLYFLPSVLNDVWQVPQWREDVHHKINLAKNKSKKSRNSEVTSLIVNLCTS